MGRRVRRTLSLPAAPVFALPCALLIASLAAPAAHGFTADARRLGMGSALVPGSPELLGLDVATQAVPGRPGFGGTVVPVPLGFVQLVTDFPTFDPGEPDFSVTRIANLGLNPPFFLELGHPADLDGDITIYVARNEFLISFADAERFLPQKPFEVGGVWSVPLVGMRLGNLLVYPSPLLYLEGEIGFDDPLYDVLAHGEPLQPRSVYRVDARGESMVGTSVHFGIAAPLSADARGNGLYFGAFAKYLLGFAMGRGDADFALATGDTIFGESDPMDVGYRATMRYAHPGRMGNGFGFDTGLAYRFEAVDVGLGIRDIGSRIYWNDTLLQSTWWDGASNQVQTEVLADRDPYTQKIPLQSTLHAAWTQRRTVWAGDVTSSRLGTTGHVGVERRVGPLALRGGLLTDTSVRLQYAGGIGFGFPSLSFDLALQTHNRTFTGERGLMLGASFALRPAAGRRPDSEGGSL